MPHGRRPWRAGHGLRSSVEVVLVEMAVSAVETRHRNTVVVRAAPALLGATLLSAGLVEGLAGCVDALVAVQAVEVEVMAR